MENTIKALKEWRARQAIDFDRIGHNINDYHKKIVELELNRDKIKKDLDALEKAIDILEKAHDEKNKKG